MYGDELSLFVNTEFRVKDQNDIPKVLVKLREYMIAKGLNVDSNNCLVNLLKVRSYVDAALLLLPPHTGLDSLLRNRHNSSALWEAIISSGGNLASYISKSYANFPAVAIVCAIVYAVETYHY